MEVHNKYIIILHTFRLWDSIHLYYQNPQHNQKLKFWMFPLNVYMELLNKEFINQKLTKYDIVPVVLVEWLGPACGAFLEEAASTGAAARLAGGVLLVAAALALRQCQLVSPEMVPQPFVNILSNILLTRKLCVKWHSFVNLVSWWIVKVSELQVRIYIFNIFAFFTAPKYSKISEAFVKTSGWHCETLC